MQASPDAVIMTERETPAKRPGDRASEPPDFIAENLRRLFGEVEGEELPARFRQLLDRLAQEERGK